MYIYTGLAPQIYLVGKEMSLWIIENLNCFSCSLYR